MVALTRDRRHRFTIEEFLRLYPPDGEFRDWELVDGEVWEPVAEGTTHAGILQAIQRKFVERFGWERTWASGSVRLSGDGLVNPDVYVLREGIHEHPAEQFRSSADVAIVVEVSLSTWGSDYHHKRLAYARAGIPQLYIVAPSTEVHCFSEPTDEGYGTEQVMLLDRFMDG